jgi:hypothetical protein
MMASVPCIPAPIPDCPATTMAAVRYLARKAVKQELQAQGLKLSHIELRVIVAQAHDYVEQHRETLVVEAKRMIARSPELRKLAEQEAKARSRCSNIRTNGQARKPWPAAVSVVHNSCPER